MNRGYRTAKRLLDVIAAAGVLTVGSPLFAYAALRIKLEDRGPVFYRGIRIGRDGMPFAMLKFRSMVIDADRLGGPSTADDDPRLTRIGRLLRRSKLDELPQFINVLRGQMSLVGPRPQVAQDVERYTPVERELLSVPPGITDWASIRFRNEGEILAGHDDPDLAYDRLIRPEKIELGLRYVRQRTLRTDLRILWLTGRAIVQPDRVDALLPQTARKDDVTV